MSKQELMEKVAALTIDWKTHANKELEMFFVGRNSALEVIANDDSVVVPRADLEQIYSAVNAGHIRNASINLKAMLNGVDSNE